MLLGARGGRREGRGEGKEEGRKRGRRGGRGGGGDGRRRKKWWKGALYMRMFNIPALMKNADNYMMCLYM